MAEIDISIIIPVFNEEKNVWLVAEKYNEILKNLKAEVIFVEDTGSTDNTREELKKIAKKYPFVRNLFINERGYGNSIYHGLKSAKGRYLAWTHADLQTDPNDPIKAYNLIIQQKSPENSYIKGNRKQRPLFDTFFTFGMSVFETLMLRKVLFDINAQPNLFHKSFLSNITNPPKDFSFDLYFYYMAKKLDYNLIKLPVSFTKRLHGQSAWNTGLSSKWKFIKRTIKFTIELKKRLKHSQG